MKIGIVVNDLDIHTSQATAYIKEKLIKLDHTPIYITIENVFKTPLRSFDLILMRTNPGRDTQRLDLHHRSLDYLESIKNEVQIINEPSTLKKIMSKEYLLELPIQTIPYTKLIFSPDIMEKLHQKSPNALVKPIIGTKGQGVKKLDMKENYSDFDFPLIFQEFIEMDQPSDKRVFVLDGEPIKINDQYCCIERVAAKGEFRSNIAQGGHARATNLNEQELETIRSLQPWIKKNNLKLIGLDLVDSKVIEINSFSPGGLRDIDKYYGLEFTDLILQNILNHNKLF